MFCVMAPSISLTFSCCSPFSYPFVPLYIATINSSCFYSAPCSIYSSPILIVVCRRKVILLSKYIHFVFKKCWQNWYSEKNHIRNLFHTPFYKNPMINGVDLLTIETENIYLPNSPFHYSQKSVFYTNSKVLVLRILSN